MTKKKAMIRLLTVL